MIIFVCSETGVSTLLTRERLDDRRSRPILVCFGPKRHYLKDGTCVHAAAILAQMRPWYRQRTRLDPWGKSPDRGASQA